MKSSKRPQTLPIGRAASIAFEIDAARAGCSRAAQCLVNQKHLDEKELEECAQLDDALADAQRMIKGAVRSILLSRLSRRSRRSRIR